MKFEIEFSKSATGAHATFDIYFDKDVELSGSCTKFDDASNVEMLDVHNVFENTFVRSVLGARGVESVEVFGKKVTVNCFDTIVDENNQPVYADSGWHVIHKALTRALRDYSAIGEFGRPNIVLCDDYIQDFILKFEPLSEEEIVEIEGYQIHDEQ